jgi:cytochrome c oxidase subunit 4
MERAMVENHSEDIYRHFVKAPVPHTHSVWLYWGIFFALVALKIITVLAAGIDFGSFSVFIALLIASTKAVLVFAVFMHLWFDNKFFALIVSATLVFLSLFILFPILDDGSRALVDADRENFLPREEAVYEHAVKNPNALPLRPGLKQGEKENLVFLGAESEH